LHSFFIYEEFGAKYEMMIKDVSAPYTTSQWDEYQRGLEALGNVLSPLNNQNEHSKKGMTYGDLMVKVDTELGAFFLC
jgi:hypothetical protein